MDPVHCERCAPVNGYRPDGHMKGCERIGKGAFDACVCDLCKEERFKANMAKASEVNKRLSSIMFGKR